MKTIFIILLLWFVVPPFIFAAMDMKGKLMDSYKDLKRKKKFLFWILWPYTIYKWYKSNKENKDKKS